MPPPNDTFSAFGKLVFAASAVRALASVAIRIPMFPAKAEKIAPMTNAGTINQLVVSTIVDMPYSAPEAIITKINNKRYSAFKNARAPSLILLEIDFILSVPAGCFLTQTDWIYITISPTIANRIGVYLIKFSICILLELN